MNLKSLSCGAMCAAVCALSLTSCISVQSSGNNKSNNVNAKTAVVSGESLLSIHPWAKKRVAYFGDSVSDPAVDAAKVRYWDYLRDWLGITPYVYARNGMPWADIPRQADELMKEHGQDFDAIMIFIGTNDFMGGVPIGEFYTEKTEKVVAAMGKEKSEKTRLHRTLVMDGATFCGRINIALSKIKEMFPTKQVVMLTPIHRAYAEFGSNNVQPDENYQNSCGRWFSEYVEAVKKAGNVWSVPVIDLNMLSGLYPLLDSNAQFFHNATTDRLHPNDKGHYRMARTLEYQLLALPCSME